jgi:NAD-dependent deacetylase
MARMAQPTTSNTMDQFERAAELLRGTRRIVALTGAGVSHPSGIPDFRSATGLWATSGAAEIASLGGYEQHPQRFINWFGPLLEAIERARPNPAHMALAALERAGRLAAVITQNIDGLHRAAGSREIFELHGHLRSASCVTCGHQVPAAPILARMRRANVPRCHCGGLFKPDVVLFGELLPPGLFWLAHRAVQTCDALLVAGTSLEVAPACDLPTIARRAGAAVVIVNQDPTDYDAHAQAVLRADVAEALPALAGRLLGDEPPGAL